MRLLHLTPELPCWPGGNGGQTRQFHLLRRLAELGHDVTVVAPVPAGQEQRRHELAAAGIRLEGPTRPPSRVGETVRALVRDPGLVPRAAMRPVLASQVSVFWTAMGAHAHGALASGQDVVSIEHDNAAHWVAELPAGTPALLTLQNVGRHYYESRAHAAVGVRARAFAVEARRFARYDARWLPRYRRVVAVSERDAEEIRTTGVESVDVVPNGVASDELTPQAPSSEPATFLFTGTMNHPPNADGIRWFAETAWPLVRATRPDARLLVVGRDPMRSVSELDGRNGIHVVGAVSEMAPWFARATAVVVPLRSGGGTRLKILEAFASGRAVVSTPVGAEGLDVADGRELLLAGDAAALASGALRLLNDPALRERLASAGRELSERRYDWRVLGESLEAALLGALGGSRTYAGTHVRHPGVGEITSPGDELAGQARRSSGRRGADTRPDR